MRHKDSVNRFWIAERASRTTNISLECCNFEPKIVCGLYLLNQRKIEWEKERYAPHMRTCCCILSRTESICWERKNREGHMVRHRQYFWAAKRASSTPDIARDLVQFRTQHPLQPQSFWLLTQKESDRNTTHTDELCGFEQTLHGPWLTGILNLTSASRDWLFETERQKHHT